MDESFKDTILIFCDGACSGNPGPGGWGAIIATKEGEVWEMGGSDLTTTNNRMELKGAIAALDSVVEIPDEVLLCTDSVYVIRGITQWIFGWRKNGWLTADGKDVSNKDLWQELSFRVAKRDIQNKISWKFVRGHQGIPGNERCDEIAVAFSKGEYVKLFKGPLLKYPVALYDIPEESGLPNIKPKMEKQKAFSYLSVIGGSPVRHNTWSECERRVKGQPGAKFKKTKSKHDEIEILKSWGIDPKKLG